MTVAELGQRMSSRELSEWMAFYQLEPFGPEATDAMNAINTAATVNAIRGSVGIKKAAETRSFLIGEPFEQDDGNDNPLMAKFMGLTSHLGAIDGDNSEPERLTED
jgi:hypothetical protein